VKHQLTTIARIATEKELPFLFVGGHAVIFHGVPRFTRDIDIMTTDVWREPWCELLAELGYRKFHSVDAFDQFEPDSATSGADGQLVGIDLMFVDPPTWDKLYGGAVEIELSNTDESSGDDTSQAKIPQVLHLIAMKLNAARSPHRRVGATDLSDVIELIRVQNIDISSAEFLEVSDRYASTEDWQTIQQATRQEDELQ